MKAYIRAELRRLVIQRAGSCCEYCRTPDGKSPLQHSIDHLEAEKHGGATVAENLCYSCFWCNTFKGSDLTSTDEENNRVITPLFNPRIHQWSEHFTLSGAIIQPLTAIGRVTVKLLQMNSSNRIQERMLRIAAGTYPCAATSLEDDTKD